MLTTCPHCRQPISVPGPGPHRCRKCNALIFVGNPMRDEENRVLKEPEKHPQESEETVPEDRESEEEPFDEVEPAEGAHARGAIPDPDRRAKSAARAAPWPLGVAWDHRDEIGFAEALYETTRDLLVSPRRFFTRMMFPLKRPSFIPLYGVIVGTVGAAFNLFWVLWLVRHERPLLERYVPPALLDAFAAMETADILAQVFLSPIAGIVIAAFLLFAFSFLFGSRTELHHFYRLTGFTAALDLFYAVPVVGWVVAFIWRSILLVIGIQIITDLSRGKAIAVFLFYLLISVIMVVPMGVSGGG